jgi:hypothetical protein
MTQYIITVRQLVADENLTKNDDRIDNPSGTYAYEAPSEDDALDEFHNHIAIACLDDFEVTVSTFKPDLTPSVRRMIDLSTAHIEKNDMRVFGMLGNMKPRAVSHEYGLIVFVNSDPNSLDEAVACMKAEGVSDAFIAIYAAAAKMGGDVMAINFDRDGEIQEGLPTFDW